jgi:hypothetical protein
MGCLLLAIPVHHQLQRSKRTDFIADLPVHRSVNRPEAAILNDLPTVVEKRQIVAGLLDLVLAV